MGILRLLLLPLIIGSLIGCSKDSSPSSPAPNTQALIDLAQKHDQSGIVKWVTQQLQRKGVNLSQIVELKANCEPKTQTTSKNPQDSSHKDHPKSVNVETFGLTTSTQGQSSYVRQKSLRDTEADLEEDAQPLFIYETYTGKTFFNFEYLSDLKVCVKNSLPSALQATSLIHELSHVADRLQFQKNSLNKSIDMKLIDDHKVDFLKSELRAQIRHTQWLKEYAEKTDYKGGNSVIDSILKHYHQNPQKIKANLLNSTGLDLDHYQKNLLLFVDRELAGIMRTFSSIEKQLVQLATQTSPNHPSFRLLQQDVQMIRSKKEQLVKLSDYEEIKQRLAELP